MVLKVFPGACEIDTSIKKYSHIVVKWKSYIILQTYVQLWQNLWAMCFLEWFPLLLQRYYQEITHKWKPPLICKYHVICIDVWVHNCWPISVTTVFMYKMQHTWLNIPHTKNCLKKTYWTWLHEAVFFEKLIVAQSNSLPYMKPKECWTQGDMCFYNV